MKPLKGYMAGANLGHFISQYGNKGQEHFDTYITEPDFARMAEWGLDHVRLPVDYFFFESDENPGVYDESRLAYIDRVLGWCEKYGLNTILDLHHAPGFFFGNGAKNDLFTNRKSQERFLDIWRNFARRYNSVGGSLIFELLNELVWENAAPWNSLWQEAAAEIHQISPHRRIIVGGNNYSSVNELRNLVVSDDERIIYTFHFYEPFIFTHQRAGWMEHTKNYTKPVSFPFDPKDHVEYFGGNLPGDYKIRDEIGREYLADFMFPVFDFVKKTGKTVYCGEYGVISNADDESAARWLSAMADLLTAHGIGHAVWSYRGFSSITSPDDKTYNKAMAEAIAKK